MDKKKEKSLIKSAIYFASGTFLSRVLGLIRDALFVAVFGKTVADAWLAAFRFPNLFRRLFGEGAFSACFIPVYIDYKEHGDERHQAELTAGLFQMLSLVLITFSVLIVIFMPQVFPLMVQGEGFTAVPGKVDMAVKMTRIMFPFLYLMSLFAYFMAILNAHKHFFVTSMAPCYFNIVNIAASLWCYLTGITSAEVVSWAVIVGGVVQFSSLLPTFFKLKIPWSWSLKNTWSPSVKKVLVTFVPSLLGLGVVQIMGLINISFASYLEEGAVTSIYLADRLLELPLSMVAVSLGTVLLPTLSEKLTRHDSVGFKNVIESHLKLLLFLSLPASVGLFMIAEPLVQLMFERGTFSHEHSLIVAGVVQIYALTLIGASLVRVMGQAFYAAKDTMTPALAALAGLIVHLFLAPQLMKEWQIYGLVASTAVAAFVNAMILFFAFHFKFGHWHWLGLLMYSLRCGLATSGIALSCWWTHRLFIGTHGLVSLLLEVLLAVVSSGVIYFLLSSLLQIQESREFLNKMLKRAQGS